MVQILRKIISIVAHMLSCPDYKYPERKENTKAAETGKSDPFQHISLRKCYYCNGTGLARGSFEIKDRIPLRFGDLGSLGNSSDAFFSTCPVCKGTGHIETQEMGTNL